MRYCSSDRVFKKTTKALDQRSASSSLNVIVCVPRNKSNRNIIVDVYNRSTQTVYRAVYFVEYSREIFRAHFEDSALIHANKTRGLRLENLRRRTWYPYLKGRVAIISYLIFFNFPP